MRISPLLKEKAKEAFLKTMEDTDLITRDNDKCYLKYDSIALTLDNKEITITLFYKKELVCSSKHVRSNTDDTITIHGLKGEIEFNLEAA